MRSAVNIMAPLITVLTAADTSSRRVHPARTVYVLRGQKFKRCPGKSWKNSAINSSLSREDPICFFLFFIFQTIIRSKPDRNATIVKRGSILLGTYLEK